MSMAEPQSSETTTLAGSHSEEKIEGQEEHKRNQFTLLGTKISGPFRKVFKPTKVLMHIKWRGDQDDDSSERNQSDMALLWRSRDSRKGRNSIVISRASISAPPEHYPYDETPRFTATLGGVCKGVVKTCFYIEYWDMAWWVAWSYTVGSIIWVINGLFAWLPVAWPDTEFPNEVVYGVGLTSFLGVIFFQVGATMALLEAVNEGSFHGSAMRRVLEGREDEKRAMADAKLKAFFGHLVPRPRERRDQDEAEKRANEIDPEAGWATRETRERPGSVYPPMKAPPRRRRGAMDLGAEEGGEHHTTFIWWPTWHDLKTHHVYEVGFVACLTQLIGATIFLVTGITALPGIYDNLAQWQINACYWIPQIVASVFFIASSLLFTLETQERWWKPNPGVLGWWIGAWALLGSVGFE